MLKRMRGLVFLAAAACCTHAALADEAGSVTAPAAGEVLVELRDYRFIPEEVTVKVGTTVRWVNMEKRQFHNIWFRGLDDEGREYFFPEESRTRTFDKPGTYPYICEPHDESHRMHGVVHVVE